MEGEQRIGFLEELVEASALFFFFFFFFFLVLLCLSGIDGGSVSSRAQGRKNCSSDL